VDADKICHSDTDFFIVTYSLSDHQELELKASDLDKDELCDMLLASAYLPAFRLTIMAPLSAPTDVPDTAEKWMPASRRAFHAPIW